MKLIQIPCLQDNYAYLITCTATGATAVVDPSDGPHVAKVVRDKGLRLTAIWNTHHHWDHSGGNAYLCDHFDGLSVYGSRYDAEHGRIPRQTQAISEGDSVALGDLTFAVLDIPGHTLGHIAYEGQGALFCGDTLFYGGCGRLFEGTPEMMMASLAKLRALPDETLVYCGHEYTQKNLEFALTLLPNESLLQTVYERVVQLRKQGQPTIPSRLGEEKQINPFLMWDSKSLRHAVEVHLSQILENEADVFAAIRMLKDQF